MAIEQMNIARTLAILRQMAQGKRLKLPDGHEIAMAEDMTIGFVVEIRGQEGVSQMSEMTLRELDQLLTANHISFPIP